MYKHVIEIKVYYDLYVNNVFIEILVYYDLYGYRLHNTLSADV